jgi:rod shape-determining protein MreC
VPADFVVSAAPASQEPARLLIDQGDEAHLHPDQPVFAGRCVVGKIQQVGRWTSSILPVTDLEYRGRAQLMRRTADGLVVGPEGIIAGDGKEGCRLNFIAATQPVAVGDEVYTAVAGTPLPMPMYYGRVVAVSLAEGAPYWEVQVKPAETLNHARSVQVLRVVLNPARTATTPTDREQL